MKKEKIVILCTNPHFAEGMASILSRQKRLKVEGLSGQNHNGAMRVRSVQPDLLIIEGGKPPVGALWALRRLVQRRTQARVVGVDLEVDEAVLCMGSRMLATERNLIKAVKSIMSCTKKKNHEKGGKGWRHQRDYAA